MEEGVANLAQSQEAMAAAERTAYISQTVGTAGIQDVSQGADLLSASEDIAVMSAVISAMSEADLERGLELARLSGELAAVGEVVARLEQPVIAAFLTLRGGRLREIAVENILRSGSTRALSEAVAASSAQVANLGRGEVDEGLDRMAVSDVWAQHSDTLALVSEELAVEGVTQIAAAQEMNAAAEAIAQDTEEVKKQKKE